MASPENEQTNANPADQTKTDSTRVPDGLAETAGGGKDRVQGNAHAFDQLSAESEDHRPANLDFILDIPLEITVELGRTKMLIHDLLKLGQGSVIELPKVAGETLEIFANNRLIAKGDVVVMNDKYGIRLTEVISTVERLENLK
jgi:flagellar motor switch protein FliN/FliY